jgi:hypothetical protein
LSLPYSAAVPSPTLSSADQVHHAGASRPTRRRRGLWLIVGLAVLTLVSGCSLYRPALSRDEDLLLVCEYLAESGDEYMNQFLEIRNQSGKSVAPTLELIALDRRGRFLPDVEVATVYGSDQGQLIVPPSGGGDVLIFTGAGAERVADVRVNVRHVYQTDYPLSESEVRVDVFDQAGLLVTRNDLFESVLLTNDNPDEVIVRLVYIVWDMPPSGRTQQAEQVVPIGDLFWVPGHGSLTVPVPAPSAAERAIAGAVGSSPASVKAYFSH